MLKGSSRQAVLLALIAALWGLLLTGYFLYLPFEGAKNPAVETELIAGAGWVGLCLVSVYVARNFSQITHSKFKTVLLAAKVVGLAGLGLILNYLNHSLWSWLLISLAASITLSLLISKAVFNTAPQFGNVTSAIMGAAPLIGSLLVSLGFALAMVRDNYLIVVVVLSILGLWPGLTGGNKSGQVNQLNQTAALPKIRVLSYAFFLGLGVALINTYVFERIAEVLTAPAEEVASKGSLLVALASLAGVIASLVVAGKFLTRFAVIDLARFGSILVTAGAAALVFAPDVTLVGIAGMLVGAGFGLANGLELNLVASVTRDAQSRTSLFGSLVAVTTIPFVLATLIGFGLSNLGLGTAPILIVAATLTALSVGLLVLKRTN